MHSDQSLPALWLLSDARNDGALETALGNLPRGNGFIFRHYHLGKNERHDRFLDLARIARARGHTVVLADSSHTARQWGADGVYGAARSLRPRRAGLLRLATAHDAREIAFANRIRADGVLLSPVFATRSHPGGTVLGPARFRLLARLARMPVIALGGMDARRALSLGHTRWAAIDGLSG